MFKTNTNLLSEMANEAYFRDKSTHFFLLQIWTDDVYIYDYVYLSIIIHFIGITPPKFPPATLSYHILTLYIYIYIYCREGRRKKVIEKDRVSRFHLYPQK